MFSFFKIADNTFKESVREPVYILMLLSALLLIGNFPSMALFVFAEQMKLVVDSSMATALTFGLLCAVLCAGNTVSREMRNGTVLLLMSKPIHRYAFIFGKIAGVTAAASLFAVLCNISAFISVYVAVDQFRMDMGIYFAFLGVLALACLYGMWGNFWRGGSFSAGATAALTLLLPVMAIVCIFTQEHPVLSMKNLAAALLLINFAVIVMSTLAVILATRLDMVPNLVFCTFFLFLGFLSGYLFGRDTGSVLLNLIFGAIYALLPNWQYFWLADAVAAGRQIPAAYLGWALGYIVLYFTICTIWAATLFQNKEIAGDIRQ